MNDLKFLVPTLITITGPTCAGKSTLLDALVNDGFSRVVGTTTRLPRNGEKHGVDYHFISHEDVELLKNSQSFVESKEFGGEHYGVTKGELRKKLEGELAPIVVIEPSGIETYERYCRTSGIELLKIYVHVLEEERIKRLNARTSLDILNGTAVYIGLHKHSERLLSMVGPERYWVISNRWDVIVPGDDLDKAVKDVMMAIKWRNHRNQELET